PSEVEAAMGMGLTTVKLFPAEVVGGVKMLQALYGPYRGVKFMPTGGISPQNVQEYLSQPNVIACGGSWLCPEKDLEAGNWDAITQRAKECMDLVRQARS
ncbi:MAG TPA: 2-dehydro-3-deoxyphosphogluconate aldolase, partial [Candidatus Acutalibacter pullicola]|nr:2-dehydro-3-deoxyphosphogluconate aldolase [Candidatus Acutalibacter pullicola]